MNKLVKFLPILKKIYSLLNKKGGSHGHGGRGKHRF